MMFLIQLTIYYTLCTTLVYGTFTPQIKLLIPSRLVKNDALLKQLDTPTKTDPHKSDFDGFTDLSSPMVRVKTVTRDDVNTLNVINDAFGDNENQRQVISADENPWGAFLRRNEITAGNQAEIRRDQSDDPRDRYESPRDVLMYQNTERNTNGVPTSHNTNQPQKISRRKRGFRSAVADRIAHGFGKRTPLLALGDTSLSSVPSTLSTSDINTIREAIGQPAFQMTKQFVSLQPVSFEDANSSTDDIFRKLLTIHQSRYLPTVDDSEEENTLSRIYQKLVS